MTIEKDKSFLKSLARLFGQKQKAPVEVPESEDELCCQGRVHVAYRGLADERLYMAYDRQWSEVRFFKPNGLKVFCADCRNRIF